MNNQTKISNIVIKYQDIHLRVNSDQSYLLDFVQRYFEPILDTSSVDIQIDVYYEEIKQGAFEKRISEFIPINTYRQLSRTIIVSDNTVILQEIPQFPGLKLVFIKEGESLKVFGFYECENGLTSGLKKRIFQKERELKLSMYLKYFLILFPTIWYYEIFRKHFLLHASAITFKHKTALFSGLGGVGKSTFTLALLNQPETTFISDNLLTSDGNKVYSVYESIALDKKSINLISNKGEILKPLNMPMSHGRQYFHFAADTMPRAEASYIFFISFSNKSDIKPISAEVALEKLKTVNTIAKEVAAYNDLAATLNMAYGVINLDLKTNLARKLVAQTQCLDLFLKPNSDLAGPINEVLKILNPGNSFE